MYVLVENLRLYLESDEIQIAANGGFRRPNGTETEQIPIFLGRRFQNNGNYNEIFNTGGPGYLLNKAALKTLITKALPSCVHKHRKSSAEDVYVSECLKAVGVWPFMTMDDEFGHRFSHFTVSDLILLMRFS